MGLASPLPLVPYRHQPSQLSVALSLPVPWIPICSGKPGLGGHSRGGGVSLVGREQPPPRSTGSSPRAHCCHGSDVCSARLDFSSLVRICLPHALIGSGAQSLKSWGFLAVFLFRGLHLPSSWSLIHFVWEEGHDEREGELAGLHPASARSG